MDQVQSGFEEQRNAERALIDHQFTYHSPNALEVQSMAELRDKARELAHLIMRNCPPSADRSDAIRKLRECVMTANASIALAGGPQG